MEVDEERSNQLMKSMITEEAHGKHQTQETVVHSRANKASLAMPQCKL